MPTVLRRDDIQANTLGVKRDLGFTEREQIAQAHFLKYCDSHTCIRGRNFVIGALNKGWHEGACLECKFNPYNMMKANLEK